MRILIVDDEEANVEYLKRVLYEYETVLFTDPIEALEYSKEKMSDLVIADQKMPGHTGIEVIKELRKVSKDFIGIIVSAYTDIPDLVEAVNSNIVYKYIVKPFSPENLLLHVKRSLETLELQRENARLTKALKKENRELRNLTESPLKSFIGFHNSVEKVKKLVRMYAKSEYPVLISGETGTGKELIARSIHKLSKRADKNFVAVNCSAFSEQLLESELFGYSKGAFTGAEANKKGLIAEASGGTLFLDEIGDFPYSLQAKILRFVQFGTFYPVGATKEQYVDVRLISATNKDLKHAVKEKAFRQDLLFRINSLCISIPSLRERPNDIFYILEALAARRGIILPDFTDGAKNLLLKYSFPGNVRELESLLEKIHLHWQTHTTRVITENFIAECVDSEAVSAERRDRVQSCSELIEYPEPFSLQAYLENIEKKIIKTHFEKNNFNITKTANEIGVSRQGLKNKFRRYGIPFGNHPKISIESQ